MLKEKDQVSDQSPGIFWIHQIFCSGGNAEEGRTQSFKEIMTQGDKISRMKQYKQNQVEVAITVK